MKRLRHRNQNNGHYYELEYIVSPITPAISQFVTRNGHFDYGIPGHIFVVKNNKLAHNQPEPTFINNGRIPHHHFKPEVIIGISPGGEKHILHSYPGFYTSFPVHPTYHQNRYSTNDPREIELYKELIQSLAAKTSSTHKVETGPHKFSLNGYTESTISEVQSTKPSYESFPATQNSMAEQSTRPFTGSTTTTTVGNPSVLFPQTTYQHNIVTKPSIASIIPTKPTELNTEDIFSHIDTMNPKVTQPITTIHYFTPIGEEDIITDDNTEMKKITLGTITKKPAEQNTEESGSDFLFPDLEKSTTPPRTSKKYYKPTTITQQVTNVLEEPSSSPTHTTKQYETSTARTKPELLSTPKSSTWKSTTIKITTPTATIPLKTTRKSTTVKITTPLTTMLTASTTKSRSSKKQKMFKETTTKIPTTKSFISKSESITPNITTSRITVKPSTADITTLRLTTEIPSTSTRKMTALKLRTTKTKLSNLTGFIASTSATIGANKITTYRPRFPKIAAPKLMTKLTTAKLTTPETTTAFTSTTLSSSTKIPQPLTMPTTFIEATTPQQIPIIDLDYTFLEDISPTKPMQATSLAPKETEPTMTPSKINYISTMTPSTTIITGTQESGEVTNDNLSTTETEGNRQTTFVPSTKTSETTMTTPVTTTEMSSSESNQATMAIQEYTAKEMETTQSVTEITLLGDNVPSVFSTQRITDADGTEKTTITTTVKPETIPTTLSMQQTEFIPTTMSTKRTTTIRKLKPPTTTMDFSTENKNDRPGFTRPIKMDLDEYDIFGPTEIKTNPTKASIIKEITESDLARELFGSRSTKSLEPITYLPKGTKIIFSNFFEASTAALPETTEYTTQTETDETTTKLKPLTSQSYSTSISFKVNKKNENSAEDDNMDTTPNTPSTTIDDLVVEGGTPTKPITSTTEAGKAETKRSFDRAALQLINHAKSIDYLSGNNNKTNRVKYKRRKSYIPKNRRLNGKKKIS